MKPLLSLSSLCFYTTKAVSPGTLTCLKKLNHVQSHSMSTPSAQNYLFNQHCNESHSMSTPSAQNYLFNQHCNEAIKCSILSSMLIYDDFLSAEEEQSLLGEINQFIRRQRYEYDHWDDAIHGFRETERAKWNEANTSIIERVQSLVFTPSVTPIGYVHVLDLEEKGYIKAHVDSVRFCGNTIAGLSLLSDSVMKLVDEESKSAEALVLLKRRSLYVMKDDARYKFTHEVLAKDKSYFGDLFVPRGRRISVICRNTPDPSLVDTPDPSLVEGGKGDSNNNPYAR